MFLVSARVGRRGSRRLVLIAAVMAATFMLSSTSFAASAHASTVSTVTTATAPSAKVAARKPAATAAKSASAAAATTTASGRKKAVIVVGPVGYQTAEYIKYARLLVASLAKSPDIDITLILPPHATWDAVVANANGADFFSYLGHGNGWPSPMPPAQEDGKDGMGLNPTDGDTNNYHVKYYGANFMIGGQRCSVGIPVPTNKADCTAAKGLFKDYGAGIRLAPNAIVLLNHLCYSAGNASPGMPLPSQDVAFQRVDNFASGFLAVGARAVVALGWQPGEDLTNALINQHMTMDEFFMWKDGEGTDPKYQPWHGWIGWKPNVYLDSVRTPGAVVHLDPHPTEGHLRGITGDLSFTFDEWWGVSEPPPIVDEPPPVVDDTTPPSVTDLTAGPVAGASLADGDLPVFTPNGDGISDSLVIKQTLSEQADLDVAIARADTTVIRTFTSPSQQGATSEVWDGLNDFGNVVNDGAYTISVTPRDAAGNVGETVTTAVLVLTAMRSPSASPVLLYSADSDLLAQTQTQSVILDQPALLSWVIRSQTDVVRTVMTDELTDVGPVSFEWDGTDDSGAYVPDGVYTMVITAVTDKGTYSHSIITRVMPFKITAKKWSAGAGQAIKLSIVTAEPQTGWPVMYVKQIDRRQFRVSMIQVSATKFTATFKFKAGAPGAATVTITGTDVNGGRDQRSYTFTKL
jgi:flagellar hook assembly protein FlgD